MCDSHVDYEQISVPTYLGGLLVGFGVRPQVLVSRPSVHNLVKVLSWLLCYVKARDEKDVGTRDRDRERVSTTEANQSAAPKCGLYGGANPFTLTWQAGLSGRHRSEMTPKRRLTSL